MKKTSTIICIFTTTGALHHTGIHPGDQAANAMHEATVKQLKKKKAKPRKRPKATRTFSIPMKAKKK